MASHSSAVRGRGLADGDVAAALENRLLHLADGLGDADFADRALMRSMSQALAFVRPGVVNEFTPVPGDVRLRHEQTGKCLFGNAVDGGPVNTWACWQDPQMAISLEPLGGSDVRIRIRAKGKCLFGNPVNGGVVKNWVCWADPNMVYVREELGNNRVRLRHKTTGQCMYGSPVDGGPVKNWPCWDDPNMVWVIDPF